MTAVRQAASQAGFRFGEKQDKRRRRIGERPRRRGGRRDQAAGAISGGQIVGQLAQGGVEERHDLLRRGRLERQDGRLAAKPAQDLSGILVAVAQNEVFGQRPLGGERPLLPDLVELAGPGRSFA